MILAPPSGRRPGADAPPAPPRYATGLLFLLIIVIHCYMVCLIAV